MQRGREPKNGKKGKNRVHCVCQTGRGSSRGLLDAKRRPAVSSREGLGCAWIRSQTLSARCAAPAPPLSARTSRKEAEGTSWCSSILSAAASALGNEDL